MDQGGGRIPHFAWSGSRCALSDSRFSFSALGREARATGGGGGVEVTGCPDSGPRPGGTGGGQRRAVPLWIERSGRRNEEGRRAAGGGVGGSCFDHRCLDVVCSNNRRFWDGGGGGEGRNAVASCDEFVPLHPSTDKRTYVSFVAPWCVLRSILRAGLRRA